MFPRTKITAMFVPDRQECRLSWVYPRKTTRRIRGDASLDQPRLLVSTCAATVLQSSM
jgi:hypothetical protein